jgi:hypothetical protein
VARPVSSRKSGGSAISHRGFGWRTYGLGRIRSGLGFRRKRVKRERGEDGGGGLRGMACWRG